MTCYIVSFEVSTPDSQTKLYNLMKTLGGYCPINTNCWAIISDKTPVEVHNSLKAALQPSDRLFVIRSGTAAAWSNAFGEVNSEWLKKHL